MNNEKDFKQPVPKSREDYAPPDQLYTQGPPADVLFHRSPLAKIGLAMIILAIIGLIISFVVPWAYIQSDSGSILLDHDFKDKDGNMMGYSGYESYTSAYSYILGSPSMADNGFIFLIILGIIAMIVGMMRVSYNRLHHLFSVSATVIGAIGIIPSLWVIISGARFIGFNILSIFNPSYSYSVGLSYGNTLSIYPAAYIMLIFGMIFMAITLKIIKRESTLLDRGNRNTPSSSQTSNTTGGEYQ